MNKKLIVIIFTITSLASVLFTFNLGSVLMENNLNKYYKYNHQLIVSFVQNISLSVQNDLLNSNLRIAKSILETNMTNSIFIGYGIFQDDILIESSRNFKENIIQKNILKINNDIKFGEDGKIWGKIIYLIDKNQFEIINKSISFNLFVTVLSLGLLNLFLLFFLYLFISASGKSFINVIESTFKKSNFRINNIIYFIWKPFLVNLNEVIESLKKLQNQKAYLNNQALLTSLASQVSHDIRSPLSALNMVTSTLTQVPEEKRILIRSAVQRINDIANNLLEQSKNAKHNSHNLLSSNAEGAQFLSSSENDPADSFQNKKINAQSELLSILIDSLLSEKRTQFRDKANVHIDSDLKNTYGLCASVNANELKRVLSNLINNSVEALPNEKGHIIVSLRGYSDQISITVYDDGKGIPEEIIARVGEKGLSHGKEKSESGSGLGIYHAKKTIEEFGGKFQIQSKIGQGTLITLILPKAKAPDWFVEKLSLKENQIIVSLDDDSNIHQIWLRRLQSLKAHEHKIEFKSFTTSDSLKKWHSEFLSSEATLTTEIPTPISSSEISFSHTTPILYLIDYELLGQKKSGLDVIEELKIADKSILVTSRYEEKHIREKCQSLGVKIIPKSLAGFVPIEV